MTLLRQLRPKRKVETKLKLGSSSVLIMQPVLIMLLIKIRAYGSKACDDKFYVVFAKNYTVTYNHHANIQGAHSLLFLHVYKTDLDIPTRTDFTS